ncbi:MAG: FtsX-like permease family protein [Bacteroidota bacterium]
MNWPLRIARRYLFAKRSTNAINVISGISVFGIAIGTAALVIVLSVFNGFEDLISSLFSSFNPDVKILPVEGKVFEVDSSKLATLRQLPGVEAVSLSLEEVAFFEYKESQDFGTLKGVDEYFAAVTRIDSTVREGVYSLKNNGQQMVILGLGMRNKLTVDVDNFVTPLFVYMAKRKKGTFGEPFRKRRAQPAGTFVIQQDFDNQYVLSSLEFARQLLDYDDEASAIELRLDPEGDQPAVLESIQAVMGPEFVVLDRYRQDEAFLKLMNIEKWMSFAILSLTLVLVAFNMVGSLWMIVLEKKKDIAILKSMGATAAKVRNIFLYEGLLLSLLGMVSGFVLAVLFIVVQKLLGVVPIPAGFVVDAYPISMRLLDFVAVAVTVVGIGILASLPPARKAASIDAMIREE